MQCIKGATYAWLSVKRSSPLISVVRCEHCDGGADGFFGDVAETPLVLKGHLDATEALMVATGVINI